MLWGERLKAVTADPSLRGECCRPYGDLTAQPQVRGRAPNFLFTAATSFRAIARRASPAAEEPPAALGLRASVRQASASSRAADPARCLRARPQYPLRISRANWRSRSGPRPMAPPFATTRCHGTISRSSSVNCDSIVATKGGGTPSFKASMSTDATLQKGISRTSASSFALTRALP